MSNDSPEIDTDLPDPRRVEALAGFGLSADDIGRVFDLEPSRIEDLFGKELASGEIKANARVAESLYRMALGDGRGAVSAAIFWLKTRARWKETSMQELHGDPSTPITFQTIYEAPPESARQRLQAKIEDMAKQKHDDE